MKAILTVDDRQYIGHVFGAVQDVEGEIVFQTGMVGYIESLTDPSYFDQILVLTYPLIGNYGVPDGSKDDQGLYKNFESPKIWAKALIVDELSFNYSHWNAVESLEEWLEKNNVLGVQGIDTRALTTHIRSKGSLISQIKIIGVENVPKVPLRDMSKYLSEVSTNKVQVYNESGSPHIALIDCGVKFNQIRCFINRGCKVSRLPYDHLISEIKSKFDAFFVSNGPGDPSVCEKTIAQLRNLLGDEKPIFGICLGHQLLALAAGGTTQKMAYGNRGHNQPCVLSETKRCFVTSQNHGYAVNADKLPEGWKPLFTNANDASNEGIYHTKKPFFSVQFHPEHRAGPDDLEFLFDVFMQLIKNPQSNNALQVIKYRIEKTNQVPGGLRIYPKKVLILGSGGLSIGQAGEFDYSGSQALKALKEEKVSTVLINPNIATVQTNPGLADKVYFLPITPSYVLEVIKLERPDAVLLMFGGQTALNCGIELDKQGIFQKYSIEVLGTPIESIIKSEDREKFAKEVTKIGYQVAPSGAACNLEDSIKVAKLLGFPVLVRAAYALGGLGSGFAENETQLVNIVNHALKHSNQVLLDKSLKGWKEIEYEIIRDAYDNCIAICNMENVDPLGIHTGESIVVAPSQTLTDSEYYKMRAAAFRIVRHLQVVGECNVQFALSPTSEQFFIIEVNPRLSRSSALASKATGYPLAYVAAKLSLGIALPDLKNSVTGSTTACFEPSLDYCVVKVPRWDLAKFAGVSRKIGSSMKSVGEVMAIGRRFEEAFQKALRMVYEGNTGFDSGPEPPSREKLECPTDTRIFVLASALRDEYSIEDLHQWTRIDKWFLYKMQRIVEHAIFLKGLTTNGNGNGDSKLSPHIIRESKKLGFSDKQIALYVGSDELTIRTARKNSDEPITPFVRRVDTVAAEYPAITNYLYLTYNASESDLDLPRKETNDQAVIVIGSGVYRIGSSVEFDCCSVGCVTELRKMNKETIMINCNPETVSTDYDVCDKLYFDEISCEVVSDIYEMEKPHGIILSMGGQQPNNIAMDLKHLKATILGTAPESVDEAEDRFKFSRLLDKRGIDQPKWRELVDLKSAESFAEESGYPCIVRPSYVLSGAGMIVASDSSELQNYLEKSATVNHDHPVVISKYIKGAKELDVDAVACNGELIEMIVSEHVENAGVHSGDATLITPPQDLNRETRARIKEICRQVGRALQVNGPYNMQLIAKNNHLYVIECNLRVSRSFPFVSKTLNCDLVAKATRVIMGQPVEDSEMLYQHSEDSSEPLTKTRVGVKVPQFSFSRLAGADFALGVEMASTGEVACFGENKYEAYLKALQSTGFQLPERKIAFLSIGGYDKKDELLSSVETLSSLGYKLIGSRGTAEYYNLKGIPIEAIEWAFEEIDSENMTMNLLDVVTPLSKFQFDLMIDIPRREKGARRVSTLGYRARRFAIDHSVPLISDVKCARLLIDALRVVEGTPRVSGHIDCLTARKIIRLPGLIDVHTHMREPGGEEKEDFDTGTAAALAGGITMICVMPNTNPAIVDGNILSSVRKLAREKAHCDYALYVGANASNAETLAEVAKVQPVVGLKMYLNSTYGTLCMPGMSDWAKHLKTWPENLPIVVHAESLHTANILWLAKKFNRHIHVAHVAREDELFIIKLAKEDGVKVTCEVAPHHLFLCEDDVTAIGVRQSEVRPCLVTKSDQDYLWANMDSIDVFATDHAPHLLSQKIAEGCPGFPGLETILALLLTAVHQKRLTFKDIVDKMYVNPKKIFHLPDQPNTFVEVDFDEEWTIPDNLPYTKADWTPFAKRKVRGKVHRVMLRGEVAYIEEKVLVPKGYGEEIVSLNSPLALTVKEQNIEGVLSELYGSAQDPMIEVPKPLPSKIVLQPTIEEESILRGKDLISVEGLNYSTIRKILDSAHEIKKFVDRKVSLSEVLKGERLCLYFHEPSSRTFHSFKSAMDLLGGHVGVFESDQSSMRKGESFEDTMRTIASYYTVLVIRHPDKGAAKRASDAVQIPVINGGDGTGEHPSQALLDLFTIREEIGTIKNLKITLAGDLLNGRTAHSLAKILTECGVHLRFVSPRKLRIPDEVKSYISSRGINFEEYETFDEVIENSDVIYMTRLQRERFSDAKEYEECKGKLKINRKLLNRAKKKMILMHPLPRNEEISTDTDEDHRAAYFRQMHNGLPVRMALLAMIFGKVVTAF